MDARRRARYADKLRHVEDRLASYDEWTPRAAHAKGGAHRGEDVAVADDVRRALAPVKGVAMGVFLWGSHATRRSHERSDIDVCVVAGPGADLQALYSAILREVVRPGLDVKIFEDLPLYLQGAVLEADALVWAEDEVALFEYLRPFRRRWTDESHRLAANEEALRQALARG